MSRFVKPLLIVATFAVGGCVSDSVYSGIEAFDGLVDEVAADRTGRLNALDAAQDEARLQRIAEARLFIFPATECSLAQTLNRCRVIEADGAFSDGDLDTGPIRNLFDALAAYSDGLVSLAEPVREGDGAELGAAATNLGQAIRDLEGVIAAETGDEVIITREETDRVAGIFTAMANSYFEFRRREALKAIVQRADPAVQEAIALLSGANDALELLDFGSSIVAVGVVEDALGDATDVDDTPVAKIRILQDAMREAVAAHRTGQRPDNRLQQIAAIHAGLASDAETVDVSSIRSAAELAFQTRDEIQEQLEEGDAE